MIVLIMKLPRKCLQCPHVELRQLFDMVFSQADGLYSASTQGFWSELGPTDPFTFTPLTRPYATSSLAPYKMSEHPTPEQWMGGLLIGATISFM